MIRPSTLLKRCATALDEERAYRAVFAFSKPVSTPIGSTPSITCAWTMSPVGPRMKIEMDCGGVLVFENSTHESAMAFAVSAWICIFISVRFATSFETVTFESGAGVAPWPNALGATNTNAAASNFLIISHLLCDRDRPDPPAPPDATGHAIARGPTHGPCDPTGPAPPALPALGVLHDDLHPLTARRRQHANRRL